MPMTDGDLNAVTDTAPLFEDDADGATLRHDVRCILVECSRDRGLGVFREGVQGADIDALAVEVARRLGPRIGGRYVPKRDERAARDAAVRRAFTGRNREEVERQFSISRRLFYAIISRGGAGGGA